MADQEFYRITKHHGAKPVQLAVGLNPDADTRYRIDVTYSFRGDERRRTWYSRSQLKSIHALLDAFLYGTEDVQQDATESDELTSKGTQSSFLGSHTAPDRAGG